MFFFFFFKQKTAYEMRISDWSSDVCSSDLAIYVSNQPVSGLAFHEAQHFDASMQGLYARPLPDPVGREKRHKLMYVPIIYSLGVLHDHLHALPFYGNLIQSLHSSSPFIGNSHWQPLARCDAGKPAAFRNQ